MNGDKMPKVIIDGVEYVKKTTGNEPPRNDLNASHWAELPDGSKLFYRVGGEVLLWLAYSEIWEPPHTVPYTLYCFDDYES